MKKKLKKIFRRKWLLYSLGAFVILLIGGELFARFYLGLGDNPIYIESSKYEYIYAPNQDVYRFGNHIITNDHSMRSKQLSEKDGVRVLLIGDSVINGGAHVDHASLVSTQLENKLAKARDNTRVLNISAGSWGPDNAMAYIEERGNFNAELMVLVFSSHDYNDNMHFRKVVGEHPMWPDSKPLCALTDGFSRYFWPKVKALFGANNTYDYLEGFDDSAINSGWKDFVEYCSVHKIPLIIYHHPEIKEVRNGQFNTKGKKLQKYLAELGVNYINGLNFKHDLKGYRDNVHINARGHKELTSVLYPLISQRILGDNHNSN